MEFKGKSRWDSLFLGLVRRKGTGHGHSRWGQAVWALPRTEAKMLAAGSAQTAVGVAVAVGGGLLGGRGVGDGGSGLGGDGRSAAEGGVLQPVAVAGDGDAVGVMQEPVEDGGGGRHVL